MLGAIDMSMKGSGIYSTTITREMVCAEMNWDRKGCTGVWEEDFETDDWGNVEQKVTCPVCKDEFTYKEEN
jgi:hypothetical protein